MDRNWIEITSTVGCSNNCIYCPQDVFIKAYNKRGPVQMTPEVFFKILNNVDPQTTDIHFSGFSEIFLHPNGHEFIVTAFKKGFNIALFSTLRGFSIEKAEYIKNEKVILNWVRLHPFKSKIFDPIEFNTMSNIFKDNIICNRFDIFHVNSIGSRGGNLWTTEKYLGPVDCDRFWKNVVLPNGDVVLCCSDWAMKHPIGNLLENHYNSQKLEIERMKLRELALTYNGDVLCKACEAAYKINI